MSIVSVSHLSKSYGKVPALRGVSFEVEEGEIFGIIGPDGAGKTTLFRLLTTLLLPDGGAARVDGLDIRKDYKEIRRRIGYMPGRFSLYQDLSIEENLRFFATTFNTTIEANYHLIEPIYRQIEKFKNRKAGKLSGGMKQKLALSCALIHAPRVLFLDEPTTGVDPVSRKEFWEMLKILKEQHGISILVSTPYMDEASWCDRIALIQHGDFLEINTPEGIVRNYKKAILSVSSNRMHQLLDDLRACPPVDTAFSFGETFHVTIKGENTDDAKAAAKKEILHFLEERGHTDISIAPTQAGIEDCFMALSSN